MTNNVHSYLDRAPGPYQSQHGEVRWLEAYFKGLSNGFFVEVGAYDGVVLSNTVFLESIGWRGVLIEPAPEKAQKCRLNRPLALVFECAAVGSDRIREITFHDVVGGGVYSTSQLSPEHSDRLDRYGLKTRTITVPARTLDSILEDAHPKHVDFVSIDVEGAEADVLGGFTLSRWWPRAVMIEVNSRSRSSAIRDIFNRSGYVYLTSIAINDVYVPLTDFHRVASLIDGSRYWLHQIRKSLCWLGRRLVGRRSPH